MVNEKTISIRCETVDIEGTLAIPSDAAGIVLFAHGSGSSRFSSRNNYVASVLRDAHLATLLIDLLTEQENQIYQTRFDIPLLTQRLQAASEWLQQQDETGYLPLGLFGASTGAASALQLAAQPGAGIRAVVSRGGRPDLAGMQALEDVAVPTLLIVGGLDDAVAQLNREVCKVMHCEKQLVVVPGATHLFEEPGTLEQVAKLAADWFQTHLTKPAAPAFAGRHAHQQKGDSHEARSNR